MLNHGLAGLGISEKWRTVLARLSILALRQIHAKIMVMLEALMEFVCLFFTHMAPAYTIIYWVMSTVVKYCDDKCSVRWTFIVTAVCLFSSLCAPFKLDWTQVQMFPFCLPQVVLTNQITTHVGEKVHCPQWNQADGKNSLLSSSRQWFLWRMFFVKKGIRWWKFRLEIPVSSLPDELFSDLANGSHRSESFRDGMWVSDMTFHTSSCCRFFGTTSLTLEKMALL